MSLLITGGQGQVGRELATLLDEMKAPYRAPGRDALDITDADALARALDAAEPPLTTVIHAAAFTQVDRCEAEPDRAFAVNATAPGLLARLCAERGIRFVYYSTDFVFDGAARAPYPADAPTHPINVYGASKRAGEEAVLAASPHHLIVRTAWVYGPHGVNFPQAILRAAAEGRPLRVVMDQCGAPTYARDLAEATLLLIGLNPPVEGIAREEGNGGTVRPTDGGLLHITNMGDATRFEWACETLRRAGWNAPVAPVTSDAFPQAAPRPAYSVLALETPEARGLRPRPWREALDAYLKRLRPLRPDLFPPPGVEAGVR